MIAIVPAGQENARQRRAKGALERARGKAVSGQKRVALRASNAAEHPDSLAGKRSVSRRKGTGLGLTVNH
tara:strand:+ start:12899 stop:13108 length:210 start_codon:yes stop_codon:yes gene_type:complete